MAAYLITFIKQTKQLRSRAQFKLPELARAHARIYVKSQQPSVGLFLISVTINGLTRQIPPQLNLAQLLTEMQLTGKRVAIECNGEIVPRSRYSSTLLQADDQLEIVVAVGGG